MTAHITKTWIECGKLITEVFEEREMYQRAWVGLTHEEFREFATTYEYGTGGLIRAIEAKLKAKNSL